MRSDTSISDATLVKRRGKKVHGAKKLKNYSSGAYEIFQDVPNKINTEAIAATAPLNEAIT